MGILSFFTRRRKETATESVSHFHDDPRYFRMMQQWAGLYFELDRLARQRGGSFSERSSDERMLFIARNLAKHNPYAIGYLAALRNYTLGCKGLRIRVVGSQSSTAQRYLDQFRDENDWWSWEREIYVRTHTDGESLTRFFPTDDNVSIRPIEPEALIPADGSEEWTFGLKTAEGDTHTVEAFNVQYLDGEEQVDESEVVHVKSKKTVRGQKRGESDFVATAALLDDSFKTWRNFIQSEAVRQAIVYFSEAAEGVTLTDIEQALPSNFGLLPHNPRTPPMQFTLGAGVEYLAPGTKLSSVPTTENIMGTLQGVNAALLACGREHHMPLFLVSGDMMSNNTLDLSGESPFGSAIADEQHWYCREVRRILWRVLETGAVEGHLPESILESVDIEVSAENRPVGSKVKEFTDRNKVLYDDGIIGRREWSTREGVDYEAMQAQRRDDGDDDDEPLPTPSMNGSSRIINN